jgi:hypothetical protein
VRTVSEPDGVKRIGASPTPKGTGKAFPQNKIAEDENTFSFTTWGKVFFR